MYSFDQYYPVMIHTNRGLLEIRDIMPGDCVYEYGTSRQVPVERLVFEEPRYLYGVKYTDRRTQHFTELDHVYDGVKSYKIPELHDYLKHHRNIRYFGEIKTFPIDFGTKIQTELVPDPLVAGALLTHGDYDDPYMNLPMDREGINNHFAHRYNLDYANCIGENKVYYKFNGAPADSRITWKEFFPKYPMYLTTKCFHDELIPVEYQRASIMDRWHYVQGAFEIGFNKNMFPESVSITHKSERRLLEFQKMLWSLGIMSIVSYDPNLPLARGREFRLDLVGKFEGYPGFFYDVENIEHVSRNDYKPLHADRNIPFAIEGIWRMGRKGVVGNLILAEPKIVYTAGNFTPRVSI